MKLMKVFNIDELPEEVREKLITYVYYLYYYEEIPDYYEYRIPKIGELFPEDEDSKIIRNWFLNNGCQPGENVFVDMY
jgi:hypothetical protein